jgi:hypothetical protein
VYSSLEHIFFCSYFSHWVQIGIRLFLSIIWATRHQTLKHPSVCEGLSYCLLYWNQLPVIWLATHFTLEPLLQGTQISTASISITWPLTSSMGSPPWTRSAHSHQIRYLLCNIESTKELGNILVWGLPRKTSCTNNTTVVYLLIFWAAKTKYFKLFTNVSLKTPKCSRKYFELRKMK